MWPYWMLFLMPAWLAITRVRPVQVQTASWPSYWRLAFVLLVLLIGLRHEVGGDWFNYARDMQIASHMPLQQAMSRADPAFGLINWLASQSGLGTYAVNTVCAVLFSWGLVVFCRAQPLPWLALVVAVPYLVTVVAMGYTRQGTAIGLAMIGLVALSDGKVLRFVVFVALAATFHKSAVILMPLAILAGTRQWVWTAIWVALASVLFYVLLLQDSVGLLTTNYVGAQYASSGAGIRVAMNAVPAALFLIFRRRFALSPADRTFWSWMSLVALAFIGLLAASPSSTAVDRIALYWIPLQLFVLSRLPNALGRREGGNIALVSAVVCYSAAVLFVWLVFADNAHLWVPYQFYPWVWFWS